jgi:hypothetical protein
MEKELTLSELIRQDAELAAKWNRLPSEVQTHFLEIDEKKRVPYLLNDTVFKKIFDPDTRGADLSRFISSILGRPVKVLHSLKNEGNPHSIYSKGVVLDILVQFEDGSIGNVMPPKEGLPTQTPPNLFGLLCVCFSCRNPAYGNLFSAAACRMLFGRPCDEAVCRGERSGKERD